MKRGKCGGEKHVRVCYPNEQCINDRCRATCDKQEECVNVNNRLDVICARVTNKQGGGYYSQKHCLSPQEACCGSETPNFHIEATYVQRQCMMKRGEDP